jgi:diguanylate cyclase (GGDEF)-like protein
MNIDEPTLMTVLGLASLTAGAMFVVLSVCARHIPGLRLWAFGCFAIGCATLLDGPRLIDDWRIASLLFNVPFGIGQAAILAGTMQFCARPGAWRALLALGAAACTLTVLFTFAVPDSAWRIGSLSVYQALVNACTAWLLWHYTDTLAKSAYRVASAVTALQGAAALAQGFLVGSCGSAVTYAAPQLPLANIIAWGGVMLNILIGNWALFLLIMLRLVADLKLVAERDLLTGLLNRRGLRLHIDAILRRKGPRRTLAVLLLDIDHFKSINDRHGHELGDRVLALMGQVLLSLKMPNATTCRWGGEEFCIVLEGTTPTSAFGIAELVRARFKRDSARLSGLDGAVTVSIGIALTALDDDFVMSALVASADVQLYRAKQAGRDRIAIEHVAPEAGLAQA